MVQVFQRVRTDSRQYIQLRSVTDSRPPDDCSDGLGQSAAPPTRVVAARPANRGPFSPRAATSGPRLPLLTGAIALTAVLFVASACGEQSTTRATATSSKAPATGIFSGDLSDACTEAEKKATSLLAADGADYATKYGRALKQVTLPNNNGFATNCEFTLIESGQPDDSGTDVQLEVDYDFSGSGSLADALSIYFTDSDTDYPARTMSSGEDVWLVSDPLGSKLPYPAILSADGAEQWYAFADFNSQTGLTAEEQLSVLYAWLDASGFNGGPLSTAGDRQCLSTDDAAAGIASSGPDLTVDNVQCAQGWAVVDAFNDSDEGTFMFHRESGTWVSVDPYDTCAQQPIPPALYSVACPDS
ncbi:MAG: hypothetical protein QM572_07330 [Nocardioides sp.]|uniref:hypothetical protein n=1 Tax=Nocardioides sp. TaxID=35761 RepID=UPI0039E21ED1